MQGVFFDDFKYLGVDDPQFLTMGWTVREGSGLPGVTGCGWSKENITFTDDPDKHGNRFLRLTAKTDGTGAGTSQAELYHKRKFHEGTYAARVRFNDAPALGPRGDQIVETFFTITMGFEGNDNYSEIDFEYLPNGGWGGTGPAFYQTTWIKVIPEPWEGDRIYNSQPGSLDGWHTLVCTAKDGHVKYYIDGVLLADHTDKYYPKVPMSINFNLWYINGGLLNSGDTRSYQEDIDWVCFVEDQALDNEQVNELVDGYRKAQITRLDSVTANTGDIPAAAVFDIGKKKNNGDYKIKIIIPAKSLATSVKLYENERLVFVKPVIPSLSREKIFTYQVKNKPRGKYSYKANTANRNGICSSAILVVDVPGGD